MHHEAVYVQSIVSCPAKNTTIPMCILAHDQQPHHGLPSSCIEKVLSDVQHRPPRRAGRSQTLDQDEIITSSGSRKTRRANAASLWGGVDRLISQDGVCGSCREHSRDDYI